MGTPRQTRGNEIRGNHISIKITTTDLIQALETQSLFGGDRLVIIEDLFARPKSKLKDQILKILLDSHTSEQIADIVVWEAKTLTKTQTKKFTKAKIQEFKITKTMFQLMDTISPQNKLEALELLDQTIKNDGSEFIFAMLIRQVRLLIQAQDNALKAPPWMQGKLKKQAQTFSRPQLLKLHTQLLTLDNQLKTSQNIMELGNNLDFIITNL